ncbi:MAG TPA: gamma-glutamyltransferase, partial [Longimicrobiales bacterium]|nr:gamma-glutamyltransferase [Longimicrobiales bacterium]
SQVLASSAGLSVLAGGGNAVDAAVTAAAVLNVVEPHMTGIGGDMFAILWIEDEGALVGLDASGRAGSEMTVEALRSLGHDAMPGSGAAAITVPGALSGWAALLERYGSISLARALEPAIRMADEGFPVSPIIAEQWAAETEKLADDPGARATFLVEGRRAPGAGEWHRNPDLAATLRTIAEEGAGALYGGGLGRRIVDGIRERGGFLTLGDLRGHEPRWVEPISSEFRGYTVWELPPAGQGIAALEILEILEPFELAAMGHNSPDYLHHLIEAKKLAFADLGRYVGDPRAMEIEPTALLDPEYVESRRRLIDPERAMTAPEPGVAATASETIYLSAADRHGNMVSFINSIYSAFGSGVVVPGTGFALQNRGAGFTMEEGHPNRVAPGKRPFHTIIPAFVTRDGEPWLSFGVMGGSMQPQGHVQVLLNLLLFGMDLQEAIDAPRFRHLAGLRVGLEPPVGDGVREALRARGHDVVELHPYGAGGGQAVMRLEKGWAAGSDPRKDGAAAGH